jgi:Toluene-4-monooxygenase system protein B (TmoB)
MPLPLYGFLEGDTIGLLIVAEEHETVGSLSRKLQEAASLRVAPIKNPQILYRDEALDPGMTLAQAGLKPLERFDVVRGVP